uniref:Uncharacterized protein LOC102806155 n=1 Tax=Saccoglossus kowalevskii TaxID=10224 RepID=A0ABM0M204_SACKO|nr:PREDICTED: uncharacterized protein LOC102806155 [Saccoglossus kowalevskii]
MAHSCVNPMIYAFLNKKFRVDLAHKCCCEREQSHSFFQSKKETMGQSSVMQTGNVYSLQKLSLRRASNKKKSHVKHDEYDSNTDSTKSKRGNSQLEIDKYGGSTESNNSERKSAQLEIDKHVGNTESTKSEWGNLQLDIDTRGGNTQSMNNEIRNEQV